MPSEKKRKRWRLAFDLRFDKAVTRTEAIYQTMKETEKLMGDLGRKHSIEVTHYYLRRIPVKPKD